MIDTVNLTVRSFERDYLDVFWEFTGQVLDTLQHEWKLQRSESPGGPWDDVTAWIQEIYYFRDNIVPLISKIRTLYYRLVVRERTNHANTQAFGPSCLQAEPDLVGMELIRQVRMELRFGSGRSVFILPRRTMGPRCLRCYDVESGAPILSNCRDCYGTTYAGGYLSPIRVEADIGEHSVDRRQTDSAIVTQSNTVARMANFPPARPGDLLIDSENNRYRVEKVTKGEHRKAPYEQDLLLHQMPPGDIEYQIPLDVGSLSSYDPDPDGRIRTIPTSDETMSDADLKSLIGMFGGVKIF